MNLSSLGTWRLQEGGGKTVTGCNDCLGMKFRGGTARELFNWLKEEGYKFPVLAIVDNLNPIELIDVMSNWGAVNIIQRPATDK